MISTLVFKYFKGLKGFTSIEKLCCKKGVLFLKIERVLDDSSLKAIHNLNFM